MTSSPMKTNKDSESFRNRVAGYINRYSIKTVLISGFAAVISFGVVIVMLTQWTAYISDRAMDRFVNIDKKISDLCLKSKASVASARRYEKDFLVSYKDFGFNEAKARYINRLQTSLADVKGSMMSIRLLTDDPEFVRMTGGIVQAVGQYQEKLLSMVEKYGELGSFDTGIEGAMRDKAHKMENMVRQERSGMLLADLLSMRRREKDFIMRSRDIDASEFRKAADLFDDDLASSRIPSSRKGDILELSGAYRKLFEQYVQAIEEIRTIKQGVFRSAQTIEPITEKLYTSSLAKVTAAREDIEKTVRMLWPIKVVAGLLAFVLSLFIASAVSAGISSSVTEIKSFAEKIASGNLESRLAPKGRSELDIMAAALNEMAESLQYAAASQKKSMEEIEQLSRFPDENIHPVMRIGKEGIILYANKHSIGILDTWGCKVGERLPDQWHKFVLYAFNSKAIKDTEFESNGRIYSLTFVPISGFDYINIYGHDVTESKLFEAEMQKSEEKFRQLVGNIPEVFWMMDAGLENLIYVSPAYEKIREQTLKSLYDEPASWLEAIHPDDRERVSEAFVKMPDSGKFDEEYRVVKMDGSIRHIHNRGFPVRENGRVSGWAGIAEDITERKNYEERLRLAESVFENSEEAIIVTDSANRIVSVNPAFVRITGYEDKDVTGRDPKIMGSGRHGKEFFSGMWDSINKAGSWQGEIWDRRKNGELYPKWLSISTIKDEKGGVANYIGIFADITERKKAEERLDYMAHFDALTKLPNRLLLKDRAEQAITSSHRSKSKAGILFLDLDNFKNINDSFGHRFGDTLLQAVSERLKDVLRESDTIARIGGDEFIVLLSGIDSAGEAARVARKITDSMREPFALEGHTMSITTSIGISLYPDDGADYDTLMKNSDTAMYRAKEVGRDTYQFFTQEMNDRVLERLSIENSLRQAIKMEEFILHYQPQVDIGTGSITGIEALIRWQHPENGLVPPGRFIHIAEDSGLIVPIGEWVLRTACRQNREWQKAGLPAVPMAVNLSPVQFRQENLLDVVKRAVRDAEIDPQYLEIEVTERAVMHNVDEAVALMKKLKGMGLKLTVDDFGTGYSSLSYLKRFPIDKLKIDQSFVRDINSDPNDAAITLAIISMSHSLGLKVIAEGVETAEQLAFLKEHGCDEIQGYYFSKPVPPDEFSKLFSTKRNYVV